MAIFHLSVTTISRSNGRTATAAAAYRSAVKIVDPQTGEIHDYTRKGGVKARYLAMPDDAMFFAADRAKIWTAADLAEKRRNSRVAREVKVALPVEIGSAAREKLANAFANELASRYQIAVDCSVHLPNRYGDSRNHHAHLLLTTRQVEWRGSGIGLGAKVRVLDDRTSGPKEVEWMRATWATMTNKAIAREWAAADIGDAPPQTNHRSYSRQGKDQLPTIHLGPKWSALERRGISTRRGRRNKRIRDRNTALANRVARVEQLKRKIRDLDRRIEEAAKSVLKVEPQVAAPIHQTYASPVAQPSCTPQPSSITELARRKPKVASPINPEAIECYVPNNSFDDFEAEDAAEAKAKAKAEAEDRARAEADAKAKAEADEQARVEAEAKVKAEVEERARIEAETRVSAEAEERARSEAQAKAKTEAEEQARIEAEAKVKAEVEERARIEAETRVSPEVEELPNRENAAKTKAETEAERSVKGAIKVEHVNVETDGKAVAAEPRTLADFTHKELFHSREKLLLEQLQIRSNAARIPLGQFSEFSPQNQITLARGADLSPEKAISLAQIEAYIAALPPEQKSLALTPPMRSPTETEPLACPDAEVNAATDLSKQQEEAAELQKFNRRRGHSR